MNGTGYEIGIVPRKFTDAARKTELIELLGTTAKYIDNQLNQSWVKPDQFVPIAKVAKTDMSLLEKLAEIPGVSRRETPMREYPYGEALSHLTGYIGVITAEQLEKRKEDGYTESDFIGRQGLENITRRSATRRSGNPYLH